VPEQRIYTLGQLLNELTDLIDFIDEVPSLQGLSQAQQVTLNTAAARFEGKSAELMSLLRTEFNVP